MYFLLLIFLKSVINKCRKLIMLLLVSNINKEAHPMHLTTFLHNISLFSPVSKN